MLRHRSHLLLLIVPACVALASACGGGDTNAADGGDLGADAVTDASGDASTDGGADADAAVDTAADGSADSEGPLDVLTDADTTADADAVTDATTDAATDATTDTDAATDADTGAPWVLEVSPTLPAPPDDPLAQSPKVSCGVYLAERCVGGGLERCEIYDPATESFVDDPDPLLRRVFLYDRWYDLYASPQGQTGEPVFTEGMAPATPESVWGDPEKFARYDGAGDSAIWTGVALTSDIFRYMETGTDADYQRVEAKVRALLTKFDVTGVPGYLARHHFLYMPEGGPVDRRFFQKWPGQLGHRDMPMPHPESVPDLSPVYLSGLPKPDGTTAPVQAYWNGHPSIDQYTGPMVAFPLVLPLLKDDALKARIVEHMRCYLNRLERIELRNLQDNPELLDLLTSFLAGSGLNLDPDDIDLTKLDTIVAFALRGINNMNQAGFDATCPEGPPRVATRVLDADDPTFISKVLDLAADLQQGAEDITESQIDHMYAPSIRGGDAAHMIHLAVMVWWMTGDDAYLDFLRDDLLGPIRADEVALTMQSLRLPDWCFKFYGDHITYGTLWQLITMLGDSPLRTSMVRAMEEEMWQKALYNHDSSKFNVMYATSGDDEELSSRQVAIESAVLNLERFGGGGDVIDSPRRTYARTRGEVWEGMQDEGIGFRCPTEAQREQCEGGETVLGIDTESKIISYTCDGRVGECTMADGKCTEGLADDALPPRLRNYADFMWQRSPFDVGSGGDGGRKQSPGRDLSEPYWMARYYGFIEAGAGQVLAWRPAGVCDVGPELLEFEISEFTGLCIPGETTCEVVTTVSVGGGLKVSKDGVAQEATLSADDFAELQSMLQQSAFLEAMEADDPGCPLLLDYAVDFSLTWYLQDPIVQKSVQGCAVDSEHPMGVVFNKVKSLVSKYGL
ncbi:MAG: hypothetical protein H6744_00500 [Deltaproteobacteria bacterium]|nr:hypothetical protein [Deltaproteobacteria bacterium]MCB9785145.1 hypothetical protein [Deltaproteobacteria bacterium]